MQTLCYVLWSSDNKQMRVYTTARAALEAVELIGPGWCVEVFCDNGNISLGIVTKQNSNYRWLQSLAYVEGS